MFNALQFGSNLHNTDYHQLNVRWRIHENYLFFYSIFISASAIL